MAKLPTCPDCGGHSFQIAVFQYADVYFSATCTADDEIDVNHAVTDGPYGDMEWVANSFVYCNGCTWSGLLGETTA